MPLQTEVLAAIFSLTHGDFLSSWCSSHLPAKEEDASVEYDLFTAVGWLLDALSSTDLSNFTNFEFNLVSSKMPQASYSHQRSSLFVKLIANLHCFVPDICKGQSSTQFFFSNCKWKYQQQHVILFLMMFYFNLQSKSGTSSSTHFWSVCKWIHQESYLNFLLLLMSEKLPQFAEICVIISILNDVLMILIFLLFLRSCGLCRFLAESCWIFDSNFLERGRCTALKVIYFVNHLSPRSFC